MGHFAGYFTLYLSPLLTLVVLRQLLPQFSTALVHEKGDKIGTTEMQCQGRSLPNIGGRKARIERPRSDGFVCPTVVVHSLQGVSEYGVPSFFQSLVGSGGG